MKDNLQLATKTKRTIEYFIKITRCYPHAYKELKAKIVDTSFSLLENIYIGNETPSKRIEMIPKIKMLDYYFKLSHKNLLISDKQYKSIGLHLLEILKMTQGWINEKN